MNLGAEWVTGAEQGTGVKRGTGRNGVSGRDGKGAVDSLRTTETPACLLLKWFLRKNRKKNGKPQLRGTELRVLLHIKNRLIEGAIHERQNKFFKKSVEELVEEKENMLFNFIN